MMIMSEVAMERPARTEMAGRRGYPAFCNFSATRGAK
jgi:hypothetical protein